MSSSPPPRKKRPRPAGAAPGRAKASAPPLSRWTAGRLAGIAGGLVAAAAVGVGALWYATYPDLPAPAKVYPPVALRPVPGGVNALDAVSGGHRRAALGRNEVGLASRWSAQAWPGPPTGEVRALRGRAIPIAVSSLKEARKRSAVRANELKGKRSNTAGIAVQLNLALLETRLRLAEPGSKDALAPAADALHLARRMAYADHPRGLDFVGPYIMGITCDVLLAPESGMRSRATTELEALLADLNAIDRFERPVGAVMVAGRDRNRKLYTERDAEDEAAGGLKGALDGVRVWLFGPVIADITTRYYDAAIEAYDARRFADFRALEADVDGLPSLAEAVLHPAIAIGKYVAGITLIGIGESDVHRLLEAEARFEALRVAIAAELHRRAHGRAPAQLADLVPAYLPAPPADPYRPAQPLGWANGRLWSVGWDAKDQGGRGVVRRKLKYGNDYAVAGDLVLLPQEAFPLKPWSGTRR